MARAEAQTHLISAMTPEDQELNRALEIRQRMLINTEQEIKNDNTIQKFKLAISNRLARDD